MEDEEPDPDRRALIGALCALPVAGGIFDTIRRVARRRSNVEAAQIPARAVVDPLEERQLPIDKLGEAALEDDREQ